MTPYKNIKGFGKSRSQTGITKGLYEGLDHLLLVENFGLREDYSRIRFQDVRYLVVFDMPKPLRLYIIGNLLALALGGVCALIFGALGWLAIIIPVGFLVLNWRRKNCVCALGTDVQQVVIPIPNTPDKVPAFVEYLRRKGAQLNSPI